jgi:hypothetical protein
MSWTLNSRFVRCVSVAAALLSCSRGADVISAPPSDLYDGWLKMYDLKFDDAHRIFAEWRHTHSSDPFGFASDAAAYLFPELARLGALEAELFVDDERFLNRKKLSPDPAAKARFIQRVDQVDQLADAALQKSPNEPDALFAKSLS